MKTITVLLQHSEVESKILLENGPHVCLRIDKKGESQRSYKLGRIRDNNLVRTTPYER